MKTHGECITKMAEKSFITHARNYSSADNPGGSICRLFKKVKRLIFLLSTTL